MDDGLNNLGRADKEIQAHPDEVSANVADGARKTEAVALVWKCFSGQHGHHSGKHRRWSSQASRGKILTLWWRAEGLIVFMGVYILGIIILAACNNVNSYAAGRWAYGSFAIIMPFVFQPLAGVFKFYENKARKMGVLQRPVSGRTTMQSIVHYLHEFDSDYRCFYSNGGFHIVPSSLSLANYGRAEYGEATFIAPLVIGFFLFFVFAAWENWFARTHFIPYQLFKDRTVFGACSLSAILYFSFYSWDLYYYYFVMVVYNLDVTMADYMTAIYTVGSCFWSPIFGLWFRYVKEFKYSCLFFALPLMTLGAGLMIHFRDSDSDIGYVIMCQIFIAFAGGIMVIGEQMAVMCASDREGIPMIISLGLREALPASAKDQWAAIYAGGYVA
ncbi:hypothetical protein PENNAL_c0003G04318 [Penicillium nalgiovense]|uniref:Major facilitator superfamily (MFS) profile domain-containing protein n=1 Tax=Penicillium nalgiovense TaxID=60175 RepID=A0A1V6Z610_PENNA|nr:hypothetical protein PENNAL_c0003G04318 [Penicillium nalgiovense]